MSEDVVPVDGTIGTFDGLRFNTIDESDIIDDMKDPKKISPRHGLPNFLTWILKKNEDGIDYWEAKGVDGKIYQIVKQPTVENPKQAKMVITTT